MKKQFSTVEEVRAWLRNQAPLPKAPSVTMYPPYTFPMSKGMSFGKIDVERVEKLMDKSNPISAATMMAKKIKSRDKVWARMAACEAKNWPAGAKIFYDRWGELVNELGREPAEEKKEDYDRWTKEAFGTPPSNPNRFTPTYRPYVANAGNASKPGKSDLRRVDGLRQSANPLSSARQMAGAIGRAELAWEMVAACEAKNWPGGAEIFYKRWQQLR